MKIILTRHGETEENVKGVIQGQLHGTLSELGIEQAKKLANRLKDEKIDVIFSSDLARAADTAKEISKLHNVPVEFIEQLRERNLGSLEGLRKEEDLGIPKGKKIADYINVAEGGESTEELIKRAGLLVEKLKKEFPEKTVLLVGHNGINKAIIASLLNRTETKSLQSQDNTAVTIFELNDNGVKEVLMNCTKHLENGII